jgi:hypothetical protein
MTITNDAEPYEPPEQPAVLTDCPQCGRHIGPLPATDIRCPRTRTTP